jgi:hypothetical protein
MNYHFIEASNYYFWLVAKQRIGHAAAIWECSSQIGITLPNCQN